MKHHTTIFRFLAVSCALAVASVPLGCGGGGGGDDAATVAAVSARDLHSVEKGSFDMILPVSGELAAQQQVELRNKLETRAVITEIAAEGTRVSKGDVLVRLAQEE
ncbi:MAG: hypothetical protein ACKO0W_03945, partial [Planctomycetota bacterium]